MTPQQIALVETTLVVLEPQLDEVTRDFYERLFRIEPSMAPMFTSDPAEQRRRFAAELTVIARALRRHPEFLAGTSTLGRRHQRYGVRAEHYRLAGTVLLDVLADALAPAWSSEIEEAWRLAYHLTAETMMGASSA